MTGAELLTHLRRIEELGGPWTIHDGAGSWAIGKVRIEFTRYRESGSVGIFTFDLHKELPWDHAWLIIGALVEDGITRFGHVPDWFGPVNGPDGPFYAEWAEQDESGATLLEATVRAYIAAAEEIEAPDA